MGASSQTVFGIFPGEAGALRRFSGSKQGAEPVALSGSGCGGWADAVDGLFAGGVRFEQAGQSWGLGGHVERDGNREAAQRRRLRVQADVATRRRVRVQAVGDLLRCRQQTAMRVYRLLAGHHQKQQRQQQDGPPSVGGNAMVVGEHCVALDAAGTPRAGEIRRPESEIVTPWPRPGTRRECRSDILTCCKARG